MRLFQGKKEAEKILLVLKKKIIRGEVRPKLAVILVGENPASKLYIKVKKKTAERIGIGVILHKFKTGAAEKIIIQKIKELNQNKNIHGILVQLPLPQGYHAKKIIKNIALEKDVDKDILASAIYFAFKKARDNKSRGDSSRNFKIVAVINSQFFGKILKDFFAAQGIKIQYVLRPSTQNIEHFNVLVKKAHVLITACGCHHFIKGDIIKKDAILIDAGIPADIDKESVKNKAAFLTPVPGGLGPLVVALLLKNVYKKAYGIS